MSSDAAVMGVRGSGGWGEYSDRAANWDEPKDTRHDDDDYERADSDGEYGHRCSKPSKENVYRDSESSSPPRPRSPVTSAPTTRTLNISLKSPAKHKPNTPVKKIDLGAAASYGKSATATSAIPSNNNNNSQELLDDLFKTCAPTPSNLPLEDDFDPRAEEATIGKESSEFGEFAAAFSPPPPTPVSAPATEFADFSAAFSNTQAQVQTAPVVPASNVDLLSDLSAPPPSGIQPVSPLDVLTSQMATTTLQPMLQPTQPLGSNTMEQPTLINIQRAIEIFLESLRAIEQIKSDSEVKIIRKCCKNLKILLPGPITVQKLTKIDVRKFNENLIEVYSQLLTSVLQTVFPHWPILREEIVSLFVIEESFALSHEILCLLCGFLKNGNNGVVFKAIAYSLAKYIKSDAILTAIIDCSTVEIRENIQKYQYQSEWENYVQQLVTLPERVANRLEAETPKEFSHENFSYKLVLHMLRTIDFMTESSFYTGVQYDLYYLSHLLSKVVINYNMSGRSDAILKLVDALIGWSSYDNSPTMFVRRKLIQTILHHLNRQAIDNLSVILLDRCPTDYRNDEQPIRNILGDSFDTNKEWHEILTHRVPFYVIPRDYKTTNIAENLIYYIATSKNGAHFLADLILRLVSVWSDVKLCNISNISQHLYISNLLVLAVKYRVTIALRDKLDWQLIEIKNMLFKGMTSHLNVVATEFRCIGMSTVETILKTLAAIEKSDREAVENLNFDFSGMPENCKEINRIITGIATKCLMEDRKVNPDYKVKKIDLKGILDLIANKCVDQEEYTAPVQNTLVTCAVKTPETTKEIVKSIISVKLDDLERKGKPQIEELDSDDDLQPYDMSNDVSVSARGKPNYLRDLLDMLIEAKDVESFEACLETAEELVAKQLKTEDRKLTEDLLSLFVHLEEKYHVDNFEDKKFNIVVAMVCCQPKICAEYLCKEIHTDIGRYSIAAKIFMLDALSEAVNRIADLKPQKEEKVKDDIRVTEENKLPSEEIIRRRLINKTRYFHSIRPHPFANAKRNQFAAISDYFFYPLVSGFGCRQLALSHHNMKQDVDSILMLKYLSVVGNVILATRNCPKCSTYCWEILQILYYMRYSPDPKIKTAVISLLASVVVTLPSSILKTEFFTVMMEFRSWLSECLSDVELTLKFGGPKSEAAVLGVQVLYLIEKTLAESE